VAVFAGSALAALSGTVQLPSGTGLAGVTVTLRKAGGTATTSASGTWTLATTGLTRSITRDRILSTNMVLRDGRLQVDFGGISPDGRRLGDLARLSALAGAAREAAAAVDTLSFSMGGTVRATLPVGTLDSTGIVTTIDTAADAVDQGTTGTTWYTAAAPTTTCKTGTWVADGPDPDHRSTSNSDGTGKFVLVKESAHFAIYSDETVADATATSALNFLENTVWTTFFGPPMNNPEPLCNSTTKYKISIHIHSSWGLTGGAWDNLHGGMWFASGALSDHWGMPHEFTHAWQSVSGGLACNQSNTCGWIYESHANWSAHQVPENQTNVHCSEMLFNMPHMYLGSTRDRYCNWQFMEYLKDRFGYQAVSGIWTGTANADPFQKIMADQGWTVSQLNDFFGEWATHNITWDYQVGGGSSFRSGYGNITANSVAERRLRLTQLEPLDTANWATDHRFVSPFYWAPQRWGYNVVRLYPTSGASTVTVTFRGVIQSGANSDFRWGLVATNSTFTTSRYSRIQKGTDGALTFKVNTGEPLFLVVMGTPSTFQSITWDQDWNTVYRYPWMVQLTNAWPQGFQNGARDACPTGLTRHANGGGCAPSSLASTVYVGPYATVLSGTTVTGSARIEDEATVVNGSVSGGTVGAMTLVGGNDQPYNANSFAISGTPTVRTTFYPLGFFEGSQGLSGTANLYGDVEYRGASTNRSSGNLSGLVDASSATGSSATDKTAKGPYTWRN
jgi:hypothetical protein